MWALLIVPRLFTHLMRLALALALAKAGSIVPARAKITGQMTTDITKPPIAKPEPWSLLVLSLICTRAMMAE